MLDSLITNKTRLKLLLKFFLNSETTSYLRNLEGEFGESTNSIRLELNRFEKAGLLNSNFAGNKKYFKANANHPLYEEINSILKKTIGIDKIVEQVTSKVGDLQEAYLIGDLAKGTDSEIIDLLLIGNNIDKVYVSQLSIKVETHINRKIRFLIVQFEEKDKYLTNNNALCIWKG
ncbi:ArsR family transcriptional regulator [uncultured Draconibacterium sp.]|uniref:ArsR family transcriptional regulator n=1 Tax=uncultured Draconibacterium sp. TaxID=1573823 RepID=UPI003217514F